MRLLLIERECAAAQSLKTNLETHGFLVDAPCASAASSGPPESIDHDAIVLDLIKVREAELSLIRQWREKRPTALILALIPQQSSVEERVHCLDQGADGYVIRPPDPQELVARLRAMGRRRGEADSVVRTHDLEVDLRAWEVRRGGRLIPLTPREFTLLQLLARRQGRVVSRSTILDHLYERGFAANSNVIDVYIRYLRQKIDKGFTTPLILTFRGQGYQLRGDGDQG